LEFGSGILASERSGFMMIVYPGNLRVFHLSRRSEVFVPATEEEAAAYEQAYYRDLPQRIAPPLEILDEAFPRVAQACRAAGIMEPEARIGLVLDEYEDEPDAVVDEISTLTGVNDLKLSFARRAELDLFLCAYEALLPASGAGGQDTGSGR
jgi:hypothetical protein